MSDSRPVLEHLEENTQEAKALFSISSASYEELKEGFLSVKQSEGNKTYSDRLVKQVYFPVADNQYHLLSLLTPSGVMTKLKTTVDAMRFSEQTSQARDCRRSSLAHETGYDDVLDLTVTGYGGTQPQNVSVLNSQNAGRAYLLMSAPPTIEKRTVRLPTTDFFSQSLRSWSFKEPMHELHKFMALDINNMKIRAAISNTIIYIAKMVLKEASMLRDAEIGWSTREHYQGLEEYQRIWLDDVYVTLRIEQSEWIKPLGREFAQWFMRTYKSNLNADAIQLSDYELIHVEGFIIETLDADEELLK